ncbi:hypothetical protein LOK49_LG02G01726 [Camellia lanceoleosa]|uniref:Uncharacterized protein n=1 Tax=Camellia lanceoleosa TaxID=1840588 RepID=A0ACC0IN70_9ERIC|nr:hypothetical protein LOK49_LG02G01726 [Camellia lanceoleosa]
MRKSQKMARNSAQGEKQHSGASTASTAIRVRSRPDPFLVVCRCFSIVTSAAAILCISVNILSAIRSFKDGSDIFDGIFRCYAVVIAMFVVVLRANGDSSSSSGRCWSIGLLGPLEGCPGHKLPKSETLENKATVLYIGRIPHGFYEHEMEGNL